MKVIGNSYRPLEIEIANAPTPSFANTYSLDFDGVDTSVQIPALDIDTTNDLTLSCWVKSDGFTTWDYLCTNGSTGGTNSLLNLRFSASGALFSSRFGSSVSTGLTGFADGGWHHIAMTINYTNGDVKFYKDGDVSATVLTWGSVGTTARIASIGAINSSGSGSMSGSVDEFAVFEGLQNISDLYNDGVPTDLTSLSPNLWLRNGDNGSYKSPQWLIPNNENFAANKVSNYSFDFDGVDDFINCGNGTDLQITGALTLSAWTKLSSSVGSQSCIMSKDSGAAVGQRAFSFWGKIIDKPVFYIWNGASNVNVSGTTNIADDTWHHVAVVYVPSTSIRIYVDGVLEGTNTTSIPASINNAVYDFKLGVFANSLFPYKGLMDEVSVFNSDQSANISTLYNGNTPTTLPSGAIAHWRMGEDANFTSNWLVDNSALGNYSKRSFEFDGIDDYISIANNTDLNFSSAYSVSFWINTTSAALLSPISNQSKFLIRLYAPANQIRLQLYDGSNGFLNLDNTQVFNDGKWHHIAFTTEATTTADKVIVYFDGMALTNKGTQTNIGSHLSAFAYEIGRNSGTWNFNGGIDEVSIYDSELSASQINDIYNGGTPTTISGAVAHYKMGEEATFSGGVWTVPDAVGTNDGTSNAMTVDDLVGEAPNYSGGGISSGMTIEDRVGEAPNSENNALSYNMDEVDRVTDVPPTIVPFNTKSLSFDGVDDRVQLGSDFVASGEFTLSFWMKPAAAGSGIGKIYPLGTFPGNSNYVKLDQIGVVWLRLGATIVIFNESVHGGGSNNLVLNTWQHIVFIRDSSNIIRCYRNGVDFGYNVLNPANSNTLTLNSFGRIITNTFGFEGGLDEIALFQTDETSNLSTLSTSPAVDLSGLSPYIWLRNGDGDTYPTITDNGSGGNNGTMTNMDAADIENNVPN